MSPKHGVQGRSREPTLNASDLSCCGNSFKTSANFIDRRAPDPVATGVGCICSMPVGGAASGVTSLTVAHNEVKTLSENCRSHGVRLTESESQVAILIPAKLSPFALG